MCEVLDRAEARGEERGISIGEARGELKGAVRAYLDVKVPIEEIAKKLNISVEEVQKIADTGEMNWSTQRILSENWWEKNSLHLLRYR